MELSSTEEMMNDSVLNCTSVIPAHEDVKWSFMKPLVGRQAGRSAVRLAGWRAGRRVGRQEGDSAVVRALRKKESFRWMGPSSQTAAPTTYSKKFGCSADEPDGRTENPNDE